MRALRALQGTIKQNKQLQAEVKRTPKKLRFMAVCNKFEKAFPHFGVVEAVGSSPVTQTMQKPHRIGLSSVLCGFFFEEFSEGTTPANAPHHPL